MVFNVLLLWQNLFVSCICYSTYLRHQPSPSLLPLDDISWLGILLFYRNVLKTFMLFFLWLYRMTFEILVPQPGITPSLLQWKCVYLTTGLPGKSPSRYTFKQASSICFHTLSWFYIYMYVCIYPYLEWGFWRQGLCLSSTYGLWVQYIEWVYSMASLVAQSVKNLPAGAGDMGSIPGSGRSPGEGNGNPFQSSCLGNPMDRRTWQATVHGVTKESDTT